MVSLIPVENKTKKKQAFFIIVDIQTCRQEKNVSNALELISVIKTNTKQQNGNFYFFNAQNEKVIWREG
jgi:hypothetical protein